MCVAFVATGMPSRADDAAVGLAPLLRHAPSDSNAVLLVDVGALKKKPLAIERGWFTPDASYDAAIYLPPDSKYIVVASELDVADRLKPQAEVALIALSQNADLEQVARAEGGYIDSLGDEKVVFAPSGSYIMSLPAGVLAEYSPADRQAASRWLRSVLPPATPPGDLPDYLKQASGKVGEKSPIVMAFDFQQALPPHSVAKALAASNLKLDAKQLEGLVSSITSLRGVTVMLSVEDQASAVIQFDFEKKVNNLSGIEKDVFMALFDDAGVAFPQPGGWKVNSVGNTMILRGDLGVEGLRRLLSLIEVPTTKFSSLKDQKPQPEEKDIVAETSRKYFQGVSTMLDDLRKELHDNRDNHSVYMERYARRIDRLPILNTDDELLAWGGSVAETLRSASLTSRNAYMTGGIRKASTYGAYGAYDYSYGGYGYYGGQTAAGAINQATVEAGAIARSTQYTSWKEIEDSQAAMRKTMTKKYGLEF
jgi:hypothetical protein